MDLQLNRGIRNSIFMGLPPSGSPFFFAIRRGLGTCFHLLTSLSDLPVEGLDVFAQL